MITFFHVLSYTGITCFMGAAAIPRPVSGICFPSSSTTKCHAVFYPTGPHEQVRKRCMSHLSHASCVACIFNIIIVIRCVFTPRCVNFAHNFDDACALTNFFVCYVSFIGVMSDPCIELPSFCRTSIITFSHILLMCMCVQVFQMYFPMPERPETWRPLSAQEGRAECAELANKLQYAFTTLKPIFITSQTHSLSPLSHVYARACLHRYTHSYAHLQILVHTFIVHAC